MRHTYQIPDYRFQQLEDQCVRLNRRAEKLGVDPVSYNIIWEGYKEVSRPSTVAYPTVKEKIYFYEVEVVGQAPKLEGWDFVAKIEHELEGNFVLAFGRDVPEIYRTASPECNHCNQDRNRSVTYVLQNESGEYVQVGSTCLRDFTGANDPHKKAALLEAIWSILSGNLFEEEDDEFFGGKRARFIHWKPVLANALAIVEKFGYVSTSDYAYSTRDRVYDNLFPTDYKDTVLVTADHNINASKIFEWALKELDNPLNDYEWNLHLILNSSDGYFDLKRLGLAVSLVPFYKRRIEQEIERNKTANSDFQGLIGSYLEFTATISSVIPLDGAWGTIYLHKFLDSDGNVYVWYASGSSQPGDQGDSVEVKGKVKKHDTYKGTKQTVLTRCKLKVLENEDRKA